MSWIKRNLYFLIGTIVALALMGMAGWYLYSKWQLNNDIFAKLNEAYGKLDTLNNQNPHPGSGKVNNIEAAKTQRQELLGFLHKTHDFFRRIAPIPDSKKVSSQEFTTALHETVNQLQHAATNASVVLQPDYFFSFAAQKSKVTYAAGSLEPLSGQLGEIKTLCEVLFLAKINSLDNIRRERVSADDNAGPATDYLSDKSVTNQLSSRELAILTPYELTFRCFSSELAAVLSGFASSSYGVVVKSINVEQASAESTSETPGIAGVIPSFIPAQPVYTPTPDSARPMSRQESEMLMMRRYGFGGPGGRYGRGGPGWPPNRSPQPAPMAPVAVAPASPGKGGLETVLEERQLKITLMVNIVKLLAVK